MLEKIETKT